MRDKHSGRLRKKAMKLKLKKSQVVSVTRLIGRTEQRAYVLYVCAWQDLW